MVSFGLNTFTDQEWGYGDVNPALFNPTDFNASQIVNAAKSAGFNGLILVCKHHDGFCLWPTKTTDYNISKSPWKNGKGDMVKAFELACHKAGIAFGIYCSPWDRHSAYYGKPEYLKIYRQQLRELYTRYGPAFIAWFDGANGGDGYYGGAREKRIIDRTRYYGWDSTWAMVRRLQPGAVIFSDIGPDARWVGNEEGEAAETSWATFTPEPLAGKTKVGVGEINYSNSPTGTWKGKYWMPAECDVPLRPGWFYHASQDDQVKTPEQLFDLYLKSVGRGADLDLGLAPDKQGLLKSNDVKSLAGFGKLLKETFAINLAKGAKLQASNIRGSDDRQYGPKNVLDQNIYSYWATDDSIKTPQLTLNLKGDKRFNIISIREDIKLGQRVASFAVDAWIDNSWRQVAQATSVGNLRLIRLPHYIITSKVRLRITESPVCPAISDFGLYATPKTPDLQEQAKTGS
jgi:alpha-L-fucosidase